MRSPEEVANEKKNLINKFFGFTFNLRNKSDFTQFEIISKLL